MRLFALLLLTAVLAKPVAIDFEFDDRVYQFQRHWNHFLRDYWGCNPEATTRANCNLTLSRMDFKEFTAAREQARALFDLK
jgi:hypothetical protein